jgi:hypothetical protein
MTFNIGLLKGLPTRIINELLNCWECRVYKIEKRVDYLRECFEYDNLFLLPEEELSSEEIEKLCSGYREELLEVLEVILNRMYSRFKK